MKKMEPVEAEATSSVIIYQNESYCKLASKSFRQLWISFQSNCQCHWNNSSLKISKAFQNRHIQQHFAQQGQIFLSLHDVQKILEWRRKAHRNVRISFFLYMPLVRTKLNFPSTHKTYLTKFRPGIHKISAIPHFPTIILCARITMYFMF